MAISKIQELADKYGRNIFNYSDGSARFTVSGYEIMIEFYGNHYMIFHYTKGLENRYFETIEQVENYIKKLQVGL